MRTGIGMAVSAPRHRAAAPTVSSVSPSTGGAAGGTSITITGTNFHGGGATLVRLSGTPCTSVAVVNPTTITCTTPAHSAGAKTCRVINPDGQLADKTTAFTYS